MRHFVAGWLLGRRGLGLPGARLEIHGGERIVGPNCRAAGYAEVAPDAAVPPPPSSMDETTSSL